MRVMRQAVLELAGIAMVVAGLALAWLPAGLIAAGGALVLAAYADRPPAEQAPITPAELRRRAP